MRRSESEAYNDLLDQSPLSKQEALRGKNLKYLASIEGEKNNRLASKVKKLKVFIIFMIILMAVIYAIKYTAGN